MTRVDRVGDVLQLEEVEDGVVAGQSCEMTFEWLAMTVSGRPPSDRVPYF